MTLSIKRLRCLDLLQTRANTRRYGLLRHSGAVILALSMASISAVGAPVYSELHRFDVYTGLAIYSFGPAFFAQGRDGNLYGTTDTYGPRGYGTAFKLTPAGELTLLHSFNVSNEGAQGNGLTLGSDGNFYGTRLSPSMVFRMTPSGVVTPLHTFDEAEDGSTPFRPPVQGRDGNFYGTALFGGHLDSGTVYKVTPDGTFSTLHHFDFEQGAEPQASPIIGSDGNLYGTTRAGGTHGYGTVFRITPTGTHTLLHSFDSREGSPVGGVVQGRDGSLYGTGAGYSTWNGTEYVPAFGGIVFKLDPRHGAITVLHRFDAVHHPELGHNPRTGLVLASDGKLYGTAAGGSTDCGVLFKVTPAGAYSVIWDFDRAQQGCAPDFALTQHTDGKLYGVLYLEPGPRWGTNIIYSLDVGAPAFLSAIPGAAKVGTSIGLLGDLASSYSLAFNGLSANLSGTAATYRMAKVPSGAATGPITAAGTAGTLKTIKSFRQLPTITAFAPVRGAVGQTVVLAGSGFSQRIAVKFGDQMADSTVDSDSQITATVPAGAVTGRIRVITKGGGVMTATSFTVMQ